MDGRISRVLDGVTIQISDNCNIFDGMHEEAELIYVLSGQIRVSLNNEERLLGQDEFLIINSNDRHSIRDMSGTSNAAIFLINYPMLCSFMGQGSVKFEQRLSFHMLQYSEKVNKTVRALLAELRRGNVKENLKYYRCFFELFSVLKEGFLIKESETVYDDENDSRKLLQKKNIAEFIGSHYQEQVTLEELSEYLGLSFSYTSRLFKYLFGESFVKYLNNERLVRAKTDLELTDMSMLEVSVENGFSSVSVFNKSFHEKYGMAPSAYRKKLKKEKKHASNRPSGNRAILDKYFFESKGRNGGSLTENINIEYAAEKKEYIEPAAERILNVYSSDELLNLKIQNQVIYLKTRIGFQYVRIDKLLGDATHIRFDNELKEYNFTVMDCVLDFLIDNSLKPFICFNDNPEKIFSCEIKNTIRDPEIYFGFIDKFIVHAVKRYGKTEVNSWLFDLIRDKNKSDVSEYCTFFAKVYEIIKLYAADAHVGGFGYYCGMEDALRIDEVLSFLNQKNIIPDFFSFRAYQFVDTYENRSVKRSFDDPEFLKKEILKIKRKLNTYSDTEIPLIISEWNETTVNYSYRNDGCNRAAYIVKSLISTVNMVWAIAFDKALDASFESPETVYIINGSRGMLTKDGIKKPAYYGLELFHLSGRKLLGKGEHYIVTMDADGGLWILLHNYKQQKKNYLDVQSETILKDPDDPEFFVDTDELNTNISIRNLANGRYKVRRLFLSPKVGSIYHEWKQMNYIVYPTKGEVEYLEHICMPGGEIMQQYIVSKEVLEINVALELCEISQIHIFKE